MATKINTSKNNMTAGDYSETTDDKVGVIQEDELEVILLENFPSHTNEVALQNPQNI